MQKILRLLLTVFLITSYYVPVAHSEGALALPLPGAMVGQSVAYQPPIIKGMVIDPKQSFRFNFIVSQGEEKAQPNEEEIKRLVKYFLASLTIPEGDLWVNLSPYEKNRIIPTALGNTELGRDLLQEDYMLKQFTSTLIYPEKDLGKSFWNKVYTKAKLTLGTTNLPLEAFNKVWILPNKAEIFQRHGAVYITKATLKVMLDDDYVAAQQSVGAKHPAVINNEDVKTLLRQIVIPLIEEEVNTGKNFAALRQIYHSLILAKWYKETIKDSLLNKIYKDKNKISGIDLNDPQVKDKIYTRYLQAYKKGVFNYIKEEQGVDGQLVARKYFSGGIPMIVIPLENVNPSDEMNEDAFNVAVKINPSAEINPDNSMITDLTGVKAVDIEGDLRKKIIAAGSKGIEMHVEVGPDYDARVKMRELGFEEDVNQRTLYQQLWPIITNPDLLTINRDPQTGLYKAQLSRELGKLKDFDVKFQGVVDNTNIKNEFIEMLQQLKNRTLQDDDRPFEIIRFSSEWTLIASKKNDLVARLGLSEEQSSKMFDKGYFHRQKNPVEEVKKIEPATQRLLNEGEAWATSLAKLLAWYDEYKVNSVKPSRDSERLLKEASESVKQIIDQRSMSKDEASALLDRIMIYLAESFLQGKRLPVENEFLSTIVASFDANEDVPDAIDHIIDMRKNRSGQLWNNNWLQSERLSVRALIDQLRQHIDARFNEIREQEHAYVMAKEQDKLARLRQVLGKYKYSLMTVLGVASLITLTHMHHPILPTASYKQPTVGVSNQIDSVKALEFLNNNNNFQTTSTIEQGINLATLRQLLNHSNINVRIVAIDRLNQYFHDEPLQFRDMLNGMTPSSSTVFNQQIEEMKAIAVRKAAALKVLTSVVKDIDSNSKEVNFQMLDSTVTSKVPPQALLKLFYASTVEVSKIMRGEGNVKINTTAIEREDVYQLLLEWQQGGEQRIKEEFTKLIGDKKIDPRVYRIFIFNVNEAIEHYRNQRTDRKQSSLPVNNGGVDFNDINLNAAGTAVNYQFNDLQLANINEDRITGFTPEILAITKISSSLPLFF